MHQTQLRYASSDRLSDLIDSNNQLLLVVNRFHIPFGFGDSTVAEVCDANGIDCDTFLAVAEIVSGNGYSSRPVDPSTLVPYLREAHSYILDFRLPDIRQTLISAKLNIHSTAALTIYAVLHGLVDPKEIELK